MGTVRISTRKSACVYQCDYEAFSTVAHVLARCGLVFPRGCPFIAIANDKDAIANFARDDNLPNFSSRNRFQNLRNL
jgi:hypothetical protein